jgi:hypothetical protein
MLWIGTAVSVVLAIVAMAVMLTKRPGKDLGAVSHRWIEAHRIDPR